MINNRAWTRHTVNGRTLIATLMEEAPSVAAMIACAVYAIAEVRAMIEQSPKVLVKGSNLMAKIELPGFAAISIVLIYAQVLIDYSALLF